VVVTRHPAILFLLTLLLLRAHPATAQQHWNVYSETDFRTALSLMGANDSIWVQAPITLVPPETAGRFIFLYTNGFSVTGFSGDGVHRFGLGRRTLDLIPPQPVFGYRGTVAASGSVDQLNLSFGTRLRAAGPLTVLGTVFIADICPCGINWIQTVDTDRFVVTFANGLFGGGPSTLVKVGSGTLAISGQNSATETVILDGVLQVGADAAIARPQFTTNGVTSDGAPLTLDGGALRPTASFDVLRAVTLGAGGGMVDTNGFNLSISTLNGPGTLRKIGQGTLTFAEAATYVGLTDVAAGTLMINGLRGGVSVQPGATLGGRGAIGGSVSVGGTFRPGALTVAGDLNLGSSASYVVTVASDGPARLPVAGRVSVDGSRLVLSASSSLPRVRTFRTFTADALFAAGSVSGGFGALSAEGPLDLIATTHGGESLITLERTDVPFEGLASTPRGQAIGRALDLNRTTATTDLGRVIREVAALSDAAADGALNQLTGSIYAVNARMNALEDASALAIVTDRLSVADALRRRDPGGATAGSGAAIHDAARVWFRADRDVATLEAAGADRHSSGGIIGVDLAAGPASTAGLFAGFDSSTLDGDEAAARVADRHYRVGGYVGRETSRQYIRAAGAGSLHSSDVARHLAFAALLDPSFGTGLLFGGIDRTATAQTTAAALAARAEAGLKRAIRQLEIQPFVGFEGARLRQRGFVEQGAGAISLSADEVHTSSARVAVGMRFQEHFANQAMATHQQVQYAHELSADSAVMNARFADAAGTPMTIRSEAFGDRELRVSLGAAWRLSRGTALTADYRMAGGGSGLRRQVIAAGIDF
jgi:autotransporter-associated beta strand protein